VAGTEDIRKLLDEEWTGVSFYFNGASIPDIEVGEGVRFCEAVSKAASNPLLLFPGAVSCPGAEYVFGWKRDDALRSKILGELMRRRGLGQVAANKIISQVPTFKQPPVAIGLNASETPDLIIAFCRPVTAMKFVELWQTAFRGRNLFSNLSSVLSVCGNVAVGCYLHGAFSMSFGCDNSREFGGIGEERLALGLPYSLVEKLLAQHLVVQGIGVA
jgi:uncharacterized protein (DUF169 family)